MIKKSIKAMLIRFLERNGSTVLKRNNNFMDVCEDIKTIENKSFQNIHNIVDVGANIGQTSLRFTKHFPKAKVFAFEPITSTYSDLVKATQNHQNIECFKYALGDQENSILVHHQKNSLLNSLVTKLNKEQKLNSLTNTSEVVQVKIIDKLLSGIDKIDILKTDTEGYDLEVIKGATSFLETNKISFIYSEVGFSNNGYRHTNFCKLNSFLERFGFHLIGIYEQRRWGELARLGFANALFINPQSFLREEGIDISLSSSI